MCDISIVPIFTIDMLVGNTYLLNVIMIHRRRKHGGPGARAPPLFDMSVLNIIT